MHARPEIVYRLWLGNR